MAVEDYPTYVLVRNQDANRAVRRGYEAGPATGMRGGAGVPKEVDLVGGKAVGGVDLLAQLPFQPVGGGPQRPQGLYGAGVLVAQAF